jgi:hypothetical protein
MLRTEISKESGSSGSGAGLVEGVLHIQYLRPTMRAADKWDSARFLSLCLASGLYCSQAESTLRPLAANAGRWLLKVV